MTENDFVVEDLVHQYIVKKTLFLRLGKELERIKEEYDIARKEYHDSIDKYTSLKTKIINN